MIRKYFEGTRHSSDGVSRRFTLWSENYEGIVAAILSGSGFAHVVDKDWSAYLEVGQDVKLFKADNSFIFAEVTSFNYNISIDKTTIGLNVTYDPLYIRLTSAEDPILYTNISNGTDGNEYFLLDGDQTANFTIGGNLIAIDTSDNETVKEILNVTIFLGDTRVFCVGAYQTKYIGGSLKNTDKNGFYPIFDPEIESAGTTWDNQGDEILEPIKSSYTTIRYYNRDNYFDRFLDQYMDSDDDNLKLTIHIGDDLEWVGNIVIDLIQWENHPKPRVYTFKATDGIDRLKGITYDRVASQLPNFNVAASSFTMTQHIFACLSANNLSQFWGASDVYIYESCEYYSTLLSSPYDTKSIIDYSLLTNSIFYDKNSSSPVQYVTCYDVLKEICKIFSLRLFISKGAYYLQQVRNFRQTTQIKSRAFLTDKTYTVVDYNFLVEAKTNGVIGDLRLLGGGMYGYLAGLAEARIEYFQNISMRTELPTGNQAIGGAASLVFELGEFTGGVGSGRSMSISYRVTAPASGLVIIKVWLENAAGDITHHLVNIVSGVTFWRVAPTTTDRGATTHLAPANNVPQIRTFETAEMPASGKLRMNIQTDGGGFGNPQVDWVQVMLPTTNGMPDQRLVSVVNDLHNYSKILEIDPLALTEGNTSTSTNTITVQTNYPTLPKTLKEVGDNWALPMGMTTYAGILSTHKVREAMMLQYRPVEKYMGGFAGTYYPHQAIEYDNKRFVFNGFSIDYKMEEVNGEWFEVVGVDAAIDPIIDDPRDIPDKPGGGNEGQFTVPFSSTKNLIDGLGKVVETLELNTGVVNGVTFKYDVSKIPSLNPDVENIQKGDFMAILDDVNLQKLGEFEVDDVVDIGGGVYEIRFTEQSFDAPIGKGAILAYSEDKTIVSGKVRAYDVIQTSDNKDIEDLKAMPSGGIAVSGDIFYYKQGDDLYSVTGTLVV